MTSSSSSLQFLLILISLILIEETTGLTLGNVYTKFIDRATIDQSDTFGFHVPKPIAYKGTEPIWPRSYSYSAEMFFDENGAAFPLHPRPKIGKIMRPLHNQAPIRYEEETENSILRKLYRRFMKKQR